MNKLGGDGKAKAATTVAKAVSGVGLRGKSGGLLAAKTSRTPQKMTTKPTGKAGTRKGK